MYSRLAAVLEAAAAEVAVRRSTPYTPLAPVNEDAVLVLAPAPTPNTELKAILPLPAVQAAPALKPKSPRTYDVGCCCTGAVVGLTNIELFTPVRVAVNECTRSCGCTKIGV